MHFNSITHPGHNQYLTREEAVQLRSTLSLQSPLFRELQICLLHDSGICTLSNGLKINRIASETRLLGGIGGLQEAQACVGTILNDVVILKVGQNVLPVCQRISRSIQTLIEFQAVEVQQLGTRIATLKTELTSAESELSGLDEKRSAVQIEENILQASVANTQAQLNTLAEQISQANQDVHRAQKKEKKAKKTRGWVTLGAAVLGGPAAGAIAHAAASSSVDHAQDRVHRREQERSQLQTQLTTHSTNLAAKRTEKAKLVEQIQKTRTAMAAKQGNIKQLATTLTDAQDVHSSLTLLSAQYRFLKKDVDLAIEYPDLGMLTGVEANRVEDQMKRIQAVYAKLLT